MKAKLNTSIFPILYVGLYNSNLSADSLFDSYQIESDFEEGYINYDSEYFWNKFQNEVFENAIQKNASEILDGYIESNGVKIKIKVGDLYSPKYYNFSTDNVDLDVTFDKNKVLKFAEKNRYEFEAYLKENYSSRSGFISFTPDNYFEWHKEFKNDHEQSIGAILTFIFKEEFKDLQDSFEELCYSNLYFTEFVDTEAVDNEVNIVEKYAYENYGNFNLKELKKLYDFEILKKSTIKRIAKNISNEIDNLTIEFTFA